jgi:SAM-dependent methyltransferase
MFNAAAGHYDRFMGRYTVSLAGAMADKAQVRPGMRVLDVGCGPGGLAAELARRAGTEHVAAIDPTPQFAAACRDRLPEADVRDGIAEQLPWADASFDAAFSCLVLGFMRDADAGLREMARVTRPGGSVSACMWDLERGGMTMLRVFWTAMKTVKPDTRGEAPRAGAAEGDIAARLQRVGLTEIEDGALDVRADYTDFDDFWMPLTYGIGPVGEALAALDAEDQAKVREACRAALPSDGAFSLPARAWYARGTVAG